MPALRVIVMWLVYLTLVLVPSIASASPTPTPRTVVPTACPTAAPRQSPPAARRRPGAAEDSFGGDRAPGGGEAGEDARVGAGLDVDVSGWAHVVLEIDEGRGSGALSELAAGTGGPVQVQLLRPWSWVEEERLSVGGSTYLELEELNIAANARVLSVDSGPQDTGADGCPVTGTLSHVSTDLIELRVAGETLRTTSRHRVMSGERGWVPAGELMAGELIQTREGRVPVESLVTLGDAVTPVFNLEVWESHRYYVGDGGVLAHNAYGAARGGAATRAGYNGVQGPAQVTTRTTRAGETAARVEFPDKTVLDVSPRRVKESVPSTHPNAPPGTTQKVLFENAQPGSKGFKRDPTPSDVEWLR